MVIAAGAAASDWPQWRGPNREDISPERSGWPGGWPPKRLWDRNVGAGCTSPILAGGRLYVLGWTGQGRAAGADTLYCLDARTGRQLWTQSCPAPYHARLATGDEGAYGGPSSTPTLDPATGHLYTLSLDGDLRCWDTARDGRPVWGKNLYDEFKVGQRPDAGRGRRDYGFPSSPLIRGDSLVVEVGAPGRAAAKPGGTVVAFDRKTGTRRWVSEYDRPAGHSGGPVLMQVAGRDCLVTLALGHLVVMRADPGHEGRTLAAVKWQTDFANNIPTPAVSGPRIVVSSAYNVSRTALLEVTPAGVREVWHTKDHSKVSSPVIYKGRVFLADGDLKCLDLATGRTMWRGPNVGHGSCLVTAGDERLLVFGQGRLLLFEALPAGGRATELSRVEKVVPSTCYPHVALSGGLIACKDRQGNLVCFSVRGPADLLP
jgi:outer membrane protein assembly factor BamB